MNYSEGMLIGLSMLMLYLAGYRTEITRWYLHLKHRIRRENFKRVLFLRPFSLDNHVIAREVRLRYMLFPGILTSYMSYTFEEALKDSVESSMFADFITIAKPGEKLPPIGFQRERAYEHNWQDGIKEKIRDADMILMVLDDTVGTADELDIISTEGALGKLVIVLPPSSYQGTEKVRSGDWVERWESLRRRFGFLPPLSNESSVFAFDTNGAIQEVRSKSARIHHQLASFRAYLRSRFPPHEY